MSSLFEILERDNVKGKLKEILNNYNLNKENIIDSKSFLFLYIDAIYKYTVIIDDDKYLNEYIENLNILFDKINIYNDIENGIYTLLAKFTSKKLEISSFKSITSRERILKYIYNKYIVEGYFFYGFSSNYKDFISIKGITKEGFMFDDNINEVNRILSKYNKSDVITRKPSSITDEFKLALYFALIGPDFLDKMYDSGIFNDKKYNELFYFTKNLYDLENNIDIYSKEKHLTSNEKDTLIDNFRVLWNKFDINNVHGSIALIKRSKFDKNYLKDIDEIINDKKIKLIDGISMILESRYSSYDIDNDIRKEDIEFIDIPSFNYLVSNENNYTKNKKNKIDMNGFGMILTFVGIIFITLGIILGYIVLR